MAGRSPPSTHHLDRRAGKLADEPGDNDDLLKTRELAAWLGVRNYGPPFIKIGPRMIRYPRGRVRRWLRTRA